MTWTASYTLTLEPDGTLATEIAALPRPAPLPRYRPERPAARDSCWTCGKRGQHKRADLWACRNPKCPTKFYLVQG